MAGNAQRQMQDEMERYLESVYSYFNTILYDFKKPHLQVWSRDFQDVKTHDSFQFKINLWDFPTTPALPEIFLQTILGTFFDIFSAHAASKSRSETRQSLGRIFFVFFPI